MILRQQNMMKKIVAVVAMVLSLVAFGLELQDAKGQGLVGETASGYLEAVKPGAEVNSLVREINGQRKAEYQRIASKNNIALSDVEALAGKKAIDKTPSGQYIKVNGSWVRK
jgi:uncharacterized protein YdbL (DUF1318 family)